MENQRGLEKMRFSENEKSELLFLIKSICSLEKKKENDLGDANLRQSLGNSGERVLRTSEKCY